MDPPAASKTSNIPRLSKLPKPRSNHSSSNSHALNPLLASRATGESRFTRLQPKVSVVPTAATSSKPTAKDCTETPSAIEERATASLNTLLTSVRSNGHGIDSGSVSSLTGDSATSNGSKERQSILETKTLRKPRPSLSDRTMETLSQIPPFPSPRRRQSGFFAGESPMRPPSRAASAMNYSRPSSRVGLSMTPVRLTERTCSPSKEPSSDGVSMTSGKRAASSYLPRNSIGLGRSDHVIPGNPSSLKSSRQSTAKQPPASQARKLLSGSKTMALRSPGKRANVQHMFGKERPELSPVLQEESSTLNRNEPRGNRTTKVTKPFSPVSGSRKARNVRAVEPADMANGNGRKISASSQSLRESIAKAKAAHQKAKGGLLSSSSVPRAVGADQCTEISPEIDPFSFDLADNNLTNTLRKRINTARMDGKLNISALGLTGIPDEVMKMYDYDINVAGGPAWYENVDLIRLNAADNEITELRDDAFPDEADGGIFAGLQLMDVHGNRIHALPPGLANLSQLTNLNLSRNQLIDAAFPIISRMTSLRELHLAENVLHGSLPSCISGLENLEILDIHENAITDLTENLGQLSKLRVLNVAGNKLLSLPFEQMARLPLTEILASRNRLEGILLPINIKNLPTLRLLEVGRNALVSIMAAEVAMPSLQSLDISNNRIACLPSATVWPGLQTLTASENRITSLPHDFPTLKSLKSLDVGGNNLAMINETIGSMDKLATLNIMNNPLRDRKMLKMSTGEIKLELRSRTENPQVFTTSPRSAREGSQSVALWQCNNGVLDKSRCKLSTVNKQELLDVAANNEVKSFILNHNILQHFPQALSILSVTLTVLDLSHNKLGQNSVPYIEGEVSLPNLQSLNITSNGLTSLSPLVEHLLAPKLTTLIVLFNRLTALPPLCASFPSLTTLLASNNAITELNVETIRGLQTLDVSSNEINHLPAQLALLQGQLKTLMVTGNKFRVPGWGVLEKGTEEILNWCRKRIPVGEEGAVTDEVD